MYKLPSPEPMSKLQILERTHQFWLEYVKEVGAEYVLAHGVDFNEVYDAVIYPKYEVHLEKNVYLGVDDSGDQILGQFLPKDNVALVNKTLCDTEDKRKVFTQWHEVAGHGVLQGSWLRKNREKYPKLSTTQKSMNLIENNFERQANIFAANVAAPMNFVDYVYRLLFGINRKIPYCGPGIYFLNFQRVYIKSPLDLAWKIAKKMQRFFGGLSAESLAYQVLEVCVHSNGYNQGGFGVSRFILNWDVVLNQVTK